MKLVNVYLVGYVLRFVLERVLNFIEKMVCINHALMRKNAYSVGYAIVFVPEISLIIIESMRVRLNPTIFGLAIILKF